MTDMEDERGDMGASDRADDHHASLVLARPHHADMGACPAEQTRHARDGNSRKGGGQGAGFHWCSVRGFPCRPFLLRMRQAGSWQLLLQLRCEDHIERQSHVTATQFDGTFLFSCYIRSDDSTCTLFCAMRKKQVEDDSGRSNLVCGRVLHLFRVK